MFSNNPINDLHHALAHAQYQGFPEFEYEDRDWEHYRKTKEDKIIVKSRKHSPHDITVFAMFTQTWSSTALGFGGLGGAAITSAYVVVLDSHQGKGFCVYFGGRFAYHIQKPNDNFFGDVINRGMADVKNANKRYETDLDQAI
jgi:hypothetical protein